MATYAYTFTSGDTVTPTKLNNARTISDIVDADIKSDAAIAGTKIAPAFGAQDITVSTANRSITNTGNFALAFGTNNAERMRISNDGNIGIGVTDAGAKLDVRAGTLRLSTNNDRTTVYGINRGDTGSTNGMASIGMFGSGANGYQGNIIFSTSGTDVFNASLTERMRIDASGNVGIGNTLASSPINKLTISDATAAAIRLKNNSNSNGFLINDSTTLGELNVVDARPLVFSTSNTERMRIDASGNVAIGTTSANSRLTIQGTNSCVELYQNTSSIRFASSPNRTNNYFIGANISDSVNGGLQIGTGNDVATGTERLRIKSNGQVRFVPLSADPSGAESGDVYYNSSTNKLRVYNGTSWENLH
jgi:hypothetical protein